MKDNEYEKKFGRVIGLYLGGDTRKAKQSLAAIQTNLKRNPELMAFDVKRVDNLWQMFRNRPGHPKTERP